MTRPGTVRNLEQNQAQGERPSASSSRAGEGESGRGIEGVRAGEESRRQERKKHGDIDIPLCLMKMKIAGVGRVRKGHEGPGSNTVSMWF